ncbi:hypothetical protein ACF3MZ_15220 [Paenibacillaceae bacterium WGS1546]|uniref:hypothetical protein n=1 Tax=Cohnella sp. WGS1546 TaxID=3366810 RepID=UPI00372D4C01
MAYLIARDGKMYCVESDGTEWEYTPPEKSNLPPRPEDRVVQLENESALLALELVDTQIRLDQTEAEQAALLLELIDKGVL